MRLKADVRINSKNNATDESHKINLIKFTFIFLQPSELKFQKLGFGSGSESSQHTKEY